MLYERIGHSYPQTRRADPRIAAIVGTAIGDARSVLNVGAGTGSYEPTDRYVVAVEPAASMRARRPPGAAPCVAANAEQLPFDDRSVDLAMALYTDFHWTDRPRGIAELLRVSRRMVMVLTVDARIADRYWLIRDYFPSGRELFAPLDQLVACFPTSPEVSVVPIPTDCHDGFVHAFFRRPEALLDPEVRAPMALFARLTDEELALGLQRLEADLRTGAWHRRNHRLLGAESADLGHRLVVYRHRDR